MLLTISHVTHYSYESPVNYGLQQLRLMPQNDPGQLVRSWRIEIDGGTKEAQFRDQHGNEVWLISFIGDRREIMVTCAGQVETTDTAGIQGGHRGFAPLWYFLRETALTLPGDGIRGMVDALRTDRSERIALLHEWAAAVRSKVDYQPGVTDSGHAAEESLAAGAGVCQDHSHIFIAGARLLGLPARYVSGYLMLNDRIDQQASHAWSEVHVDGLGWVGFDVSNGISPDARYVRVATGLDYADAAPISGMRFGSHGIERLVVDIQVAQ
jgi:transglutaminase-like putative cysteine protease